MLGANYLAKTYLAGYGEADFVAPIGTIVTVSRTRISAVATKDSLDVTFTSDENFTHYQIRYVPSSGTPVSGGVLVEQDQIPPSGGLAMTSYTTTITEPELITAVGGEGSYILKLFLQDASGNWSA